jgi:hypothetical protein
MTFPHSWQLAGRGHPAGQQAGHWRWVFVPLPLLIAWAALSPPDPNRAMMTRVLDRCVSAVATQPGLDGHRLIPSSQHTEQDRTTIDFGARRSSPLGWNAGELIRVRCTEHAGRTTLEFLPGTAP